MSGMFPEPNFILDPYGYRSKTLDKTKEYFETIEKYYDPRQKEAARNATIKAAAYLGVVSCLPKNPITGVVLGAGIVAREVEKSVKQFQCPKGEIAPITDIFPTCNESNTALLIGLKGVQVPNDLVDATANLIAKIAIEKADKYGITTENITNTLKLPKRMFDAT